MNVLTRPIVYLDAFLIVLKDSRVWVFLAILLCFHLVLELRRRFCGYLAL